MYQRIARRTNHNWMTRLPYLKTIDLNQLRQYENTCDKPWIDLHKNGRIRK